VKNRLCLLTLFASLVFAIALPASAQILYSDGPINGETDAWTINDGFVVSDTFILFGNSRVTGMSFGAWLFPGDTLESVDVTFTHFEFGGTLYFNQVVSFTASDCFVNNYGFDVCQETGFFNGVNLAAGTYWMNLQNAVVNTGDPVYWDENSGPSSSSENGGTLPAESFSILGSSSTAGTVPEPGSLLLLAGGAVGMAGILRRKLR
jgi:hypothetical protein